MSVSQGAVRTTYLADEVPVPSASGVHRASRRRSGRWPAAIIWVLLLTAVSMCLQAASVVESRRASPLGLIFFWASLLMLIAPVSWYLLRDSATRNSRMAAVAAFGAVSTLIYRMGDPLLFTGFDEQLHMRTLIDIVTSRSLFAANPLLNVSPQYPGLEATTVALHNTFGTSLAITGGILIVICRVLFVTVLFAVAEHLTSSPKIAGLTVVAYGASQQFYFFNAQYSYQSLGIVLALGAVGLTSRAGQVRARRQRLAMVISAGVCLTALTFTHHVTSWLCAVFLLLWWLVARGRDQWPVRTAALVALATNGLWSLANQTSLRNYFFPVIKSTANQAVGFVRGTSNKTLFKDGSGVTTPRWQQLTLLGYTGLVCVLAVTIGAVALYRAIKQRSGTRALLALLAVAFPGTFAFRFLPTGGEFGDRSTTFLFIPLAYLIAAYVVLHTTPRSGRPRASRGRLLVLSVWVVTCFAFIGGVVLGSGPDWERTPGPYLVEAENRSIDAYTLNAASWAHANLPAGTRIAADRIGGEVLAAEARMWPVVLTTGDSDPADLYYDNTWSSESTALATKLHISYLYVDTRWSDELPHATVYFHAGEKPDVQSLTPQALSKFASIPGVTVAERDGPIVIYNMTSLTGNTLRSGWTGDRRPPSILEAGVAGFLVGLVVLGFAFSHVGAGSARFARRLTTCAGLPLTVTASLGLLCILSMAAVATGLSWNPVATLTFTVTVVGGRLAMRRRIAPRRALVPQTYLPTKFLLVLIVLLMAGSIAVAAVSAAGAHGVGHFAAIATQVHS